MINIKNVGGKINNYYIKQIEIINLLTMKRMEKLMNLVKNKEIERLYARADFLFIQNSLFDNLTTCFYSLVISVIASFVCQMMECKRVWLMFVWMVTILLCFLWNYFVKICQKRDRLDHIDIILMNMKENC